MVKAVYNCLNYAIFNIQHGTLYRIDLAKAARSLSREGVRGGDTRFDDLSGKLDLGGNEYRFADLKVTSGLQNGSGNVNVAADKTVTGNINVALRGSVGLLNAPLEVVGTIDDPVVGLKRSALAGAAIVTAVLGPGLGTTLGIKASELVEKLGACSRVTHPTSSLNQNEPAKTSCDLHAPQASQSSPGHRAELQQRI